MIPQSFIQDLLNRIDIVDVVGRHVQLKKGGANFMGLCPFHTEKSPSFTVSPTKQFYHCFGCGAHGSAIGFLMEHGGLSYVEAIEELAQSVGLTVPREGPRLSPEQQAQKRAQTVSLGDALAKASQYYRQQLRGAKRAIDYLKGRGLSGEIAARFGLGYAPDGWQNLEAVFGGYRGDVAKALVESGLVIESDRAGNDGEPRRYDRFRDRVMFPIRNAKGAIIGFGGRVLDAGEPKYLNSPETPLFSKGTELYGLFEARDAIRAAGYVLVTEGYMDVVALAQLGFANAVATLGTACTPVHVQKLFRQTDTVVFAFDGDAAGRRAARRALEASLPHLGDDKTVRFLFLPAEHDPDSYVRTFGADAFAAEVAQAMPLSRFLLKIITDGRDLRQAEDRARAQHDAKPLLQALPAGALRLQIVRVVAEATGSTPAEIEVLCELRRAVSSRVAPPRAKRQPPAGLDQQLLRLLLRFPVLAQILNDEIRARLTASDYPQAELFADLLQHCDDSPPEIGFAAFHERLVRSPLVQAYQPLIASVVGDDVALTAAQDELRGVVRKLLLQALDAEQNQLAQALQDGGGSDADKARYRANAQRIAALREGRENP